MSTMNHNPLRRAASRRDRGFTLVESLVSMVVISVGMLGIAALYVEGLRASRTSVYRTMAIDLASDMADRIRANPTARASYGVDAVGAGALGDCVNGAADCTPATLAADDIAWWKQSVGTLLPQGTATIAAVAGAEISRYTITINWAEPGVEAPLQYALAVQL